MPAHRRLTAALLAACLGWSALTLTLGSSATAEVPADVATADAPRAPHDPATYYAGTEGLSGATLAARLNSIIKGHTTLSYDQVWSALKVTDADPAAPTTSMIDFYSGSTLVSSNQCGSSCGTSGWNREHTWPQSHGDFGTSAGIGTDLFHMRPEFGSTNSSRGNLDFDNTVHTGNPVPLCSMCKRDSDSFEPRDAIKGDLARGLFYMAVRYEGNDGYLNLKMNDLTCNGSGTKSPNMGKLSTLVAWSLADPPDDRERARNDLIDSDYQHNRNPFIDHPEWVTSIFGNGVGAGPACGSTSGTEYVPGGTTPPANQPPTATPVTTSTAEDTAVTFTLTATDPEGAPLTYALSGQPAHGTVSLAGNQATYTPALDYHGTDSFGWTVSDGTSTVSSTATITVTPVNDAPVAQPASASTPRGTTVQVALVATDVDDTDLTYAVATGPAHGTVQVQGATATYAPAAGYTGTDSFTYVARDPSGATSAPATVTITVTQTQGAPVPTAVTASTAEDAPVTFTLTATDPDGDQLTYALSGQPAHGTVSLTGNQATYTPAPDYHGTDTFGWTVSDGTSTVSSTATITVAPVNDAPVAESTTVSTPESTALVITLAGSDVDGDALTYALRSPAPQHGTVTVPIGSQVTYTPEPGYIGTDSFGWIVTDGTRSSAVATTTIDVTAVNHAPTVEAVSANTTVSDPVTFPLLGDDVDDNPLTYATTQPDHGTVSVSDLAATYTPTPGWVGMDTFTYTASDGQLTSPPETVTVTVAPAPTTTTLSTTRAVRGARVTTTVSVASDYDVPAGRVTLRSAGRVLGSAAVGPGGRATVAWTPTSAGTTTVAATFVGAAPFADSSSAASAVRVARSAGRTTLTAGVLKRGKAGVFKVRVAKIGAVAPTGRVQLTVGAKRLTARLVRGVATVRVASLPRTAKVRVVARYAGDGQYLPGSAARTYALKR